jgi:hypothetical protein
MRKNDIDEDVAETAQLRESSSDAGAPRQRRHQPPQQQEPQPSDDRDSSSTATKLSDADYFRLHYGHQPNNTSGNTGRNQRLKGSLKTLKTTLIVAMVMIVGGVITAIVYLLITRLGLGKPFPVPKYASATPLLPESSLEVVAELPLPAGNIAVSQSGRIFFNFHPVKT